MKKFLALFLLMVSFLFVGCQGTASPGAAESGLKGAGYTVEVMNATQAKERVGGVEFVVSPTSAILATKGTNEVIIIFYFNNIEDTDKFVKENIAVMYRFAERYTESPKTGSHNNAAYAGTPNAVKAAGFPVL